MLIVLHHCPVSSVLPNCNLFTSAISKSLSTDTLIVLEIRGSDLSIVFEAQLTLSPLSMLSDRDMNYSRCASLLIVLLYLSTYLLRRIHSEAYTPGWSWVWPRRGLSSKAYAVYTQRISTSHLIGLHQRRGLHQSALDCL